MKQRFSTHTTLIELTLSLMFLMLTSVTILGLFMTAYEQSTEAGRLTKAVQLAQDCAAMIAGNENPEQMLMENGFFRREDGALKREVGGGMLVSIGFRQEQTEVGCLLRATVRVTRENELLTEWPVARYYNKEVIHL